jgi:excisionase family DNA binding protein
MTMLTDDYVTASEASRILGVSRQRVATMVRENEIDHVRPWPRTVLIPRSALDAWMHGQRPAPIHKTACRHWILEREQCERIDMIDPEYLGQLVALFISTFRPEWDDTSKRNWCIGMLSMLMRRGGAPS